MADGGVLLVGSLPLTSAREVFTKTAAALPGRLQSIPDGETGDRFNFIGWQRCSFPRETLRKFCGGDDLPAAHSGDSTALKSYAIFTSARDQGIIPQGVRFQVSLPSPMNPLQCLTKPEFHRQLEPLYEKRLLESLEVIIQKIPAEDLALQWGLCVEMIALEHEKGRTIDPLFIPHFSPIKEGILGRVRRICELIPDNVPLGFHLCYGDLHHRHFIEPEDMALMVDLANSIIEQISHPVSWIHMPVPKGRDDILYFEPLKKLNIPASATVYLGLVHANDEEGTRKRIKVAQSVLPKFGVATACGTGRTPIEDLDDILRISEAVTKPGVSL